MVRPDPYNFEARLGSLDRRRNQQRRTGLPLVDIIYTPSDKFIFDGSFIRLKCYSGIFSSCKPFAKTSQTFVFM